MRRREFITLLGGVAAAWPLPTKGQQSERMRRIGVLMALPETDQGAKALLLEFKRGLADSGWTDGPADRHLAARGDDCQSRKHP